MRKVLFTATAAAVLATSSFAFAATAHRTTGMVKAYDGATMTLALADGTTFQLPKHFKNPGIKAGEKVQVSWEKSKGHDMAESVKILR